MSLCTSERPPGGPGGSGSTEGAGGVVHNGLLSAGEWASSSTPTASSSAGWAGAQAVLSRRPGLAPLAAHCRTLPLSLLRAPPMPPGLRSLPTAVVARRALANCIIAVTTKPALPTTSDRLPRALGSGGLFNLPQDRAGLRRGAPPLALGVFEEVQTMVQ